MIRVSVIVISMLASINVAECKEFYAGLGIAVGWLGFDDELETRTGDGDPGRTLKFIGPGIVVGSHKDNLEFGVYDLEVSTKKCDTLRIEGNYNIESHSSFYFPLGLYLNVEQGSCTSKSNAIILPLPNIGVRFRKKFGLFQVASSFSIGFYGEPRFSFSILH